MGRKKVILPPELPPEINEEEIEVSDEDFDFVTRNRDFAGFLTKLDTKSIDKHVSRVANKKEDELEALYERRNRKATENKPKEEDALEVNRVDALPIKTLDGQLQYRTAKKSASVDLIDNKDPTTETKDDEDNGIVRLTKAERRQKLKKIKREAKKQIKGEVKDEPVEESLHSEVLAKVEKDLTAEELLARKKFQLAELGKQLLENPESSIKSLKELLDICNDEDRNIVILALFSLLAVFRDIIPGYRIRLPTKKELEMTVSKAVRQTRFYESTLLRSYKAYLLRLMALEKKPNFQRAAVRCMCDLLIAVPHFNFRENLLACVVRNISSSDDGVRKRCCEAIKSTFVNEGKHGGEATLEAVRLIAEQVKIHDCQLHPDCLDVFLSLKFDEDLGKSEPKETEKVKPKKKRQWRTEDPKQLKGNDLKKSKQELLAKTREEVNADFKAVSFTPDAGERRKMQSATLAAVFETYFRILKRSVDPPGLGSTPNYSVSGGFGDHPLLASCLNGLGKFSHLIDIDFMGDLMGCLKKLAGYSDNSSGSSSQNKFSVSERLQCCIVAFRVMRSNLDALNVDLQEFFVQLYNLLLEYRPDRDRGEVLAEALKTMLWEGKQHNMQRAAAFIKRLATFTLSFGTAEAMAALVTLKHLLQKNAKCRCLLESDAGGGSLAGLVAKYQPDTSDPNLSGALSSVLWELSLLSKHYSPTIAAMASSISSMATANPNFNQAYLSTNSPLQAFEGHSIEKELPKPITRAPRTLSRKRKKWGKSSGFVVLKPETVEGIESSVDEHAVVSKLEDHFSVLRDISENERLRGELNRTMAAINMYEEYKKQQQKKKKKRKEEPKGGKAKKSRKAL